jgi:hypothetical protein
MDAKNNKKNIKKKYDLFLKQFFRKKRILKEDGRYLIYYYFKKSSADRKTN